MVSRNNISIITTSILHITRIIGRQWHVCWPSAHKNQSLQINDKKMALTSGKVTKLQKERSCSNFYQRKTLFKYSPLHWQSCYWWWKMKAQGGCKPWPTTSTIIKPNKEIQVFSGILTESWKTITNQAFTLLFLGLSVIKVVVCGSIDI